MFLNVWRAHLNIVAGGVDCLGQLCNGTTAWTVVFQGECILRSQTLTYSRSTLLIVENWDAEAIVMVWLKGTKAVGVSLVPFRPEVVSFKGFWPCSHGIGQLINEVVLLTCWYVSGAK